MYEIIVVSFLQNCVKSLDYESSTILTTLSCINDIALRAPEVFEPHHTTIIRDFVVKELLVKDRVSLYLFGKS